MTGAGCAAPPISAKFCPFWSLSPQFSALGAHATRCVWNFGNDRAEHRQGAAGRTPGTASPDLARYGGTLVQRGSRPTRAVLLDRCRSFSRSAAPAPVRPRCPPGHPGRVQPRGPPETACATARTPGCAGRSSSRTGCPSAPASGMRQLGYSSTVPGMFCGRRSPAASASETPISTAGVRVR